MGSRPNPLSPSVPNFRSRLQSRLPTRLPASPTSSRSGILRSSTIFTAYSRPTCAGTTRSRTARSGISGPCAPGPGPTSTACSRPVRLGTTSPCTSRSSTTSTANARSVRYSTARSSTASAADARPARSRPYRTRPLCSHRSTSSHDPSPRSTACPSTYPSSPRRTPRPRRSSRKFSPLQDRDCARCDEEREPGSQAGKWDYENHEQWLGWR
jgi:hypothetical protein